MPNPFGAPEISAQDAAAKRESINPPALVDVREPEEYGVRINDDGVLYLPLSQIAEQRLDAIPDTLADKAQEIIVLCHHGLRSAQVVAFLQSEGWTNVLNMDGGIDAWARDVDPEIGSY